MYELIECSVITLTTGDELIVLYYSSRINANSILWITPRQFIKIIKAIC